MRTCGPALTDLGDDPRHLLNAAGTGIDVGRAQFGGQQMPAAEHVERQIAVGVVVTVEKPLLLMAVQRIVGGVEIEGDLWRWRRMGIDKQVDKQGFDGRRIIADLVVTGRLLAAQFQPVERRFASQRSTIRAMGFQLAAQHRHHRVVAQLIVVDQILVAQCDPEHALPDQTRHRVFDQIGRAVIGEAAGKALD